ncbi:hypothetical protein B484DRAFT_452046, partial [Ochromonadaceae sp. CCMP2298]
MGEQTPRKQSFVREKQDVFEVLMDGSKSFWKTRSSLDILIVSHPGICIELVAYNAEIGAEARIYINSLLLAAKFTDSAEFNENLSAMKEAFNRRKETYKVADLAKQVVSEHMVAFIMKRLNTVGGYTHRITLLPLSDDVCDKENANKLDIICGMPVGLHPVKVTYAKLASAAEILCAQHGLCAEKERLSHALRLAELLSVAADNLKLIVEERRKLERAMKSLSLARLRWVKVIHKVLVRNYLARVKKRLLCSHLAAWYQASLDEEQSLDAEEAAVDAMEARLEEEKQISATPKGRSRHSRRSLDNSDISQLRPLRLDSGKSPRVWASKHTATLPKLDLSHILLDPMERRRLAKADRATKLGRLGSTPKSLSSRADKKAPSLIETYAEIVSQVTVTLVVPPPEPKPEPEPPLSGSPMRRPRGRIVVGYRTL